MACNHWAMWAGGSNTADVNNPSFGAQARLARGLAQAGGTHHLPRLVGPTICPGSLLCAGAGNGLPRGPFAQVWCSGGHALRAYIAIRNFQAQICLVKVQS
ncbi:unnamed protein product [Prunus armeniaca]